VLAILADRADRSFERAEQPAERDLLLVVERLPAKHQHAMALQRRHDHAQRVWRHRTAQVDTGHLRDEHRMQLSCVHCRRAPAIGTQ